MISKLFRSRHTTPGGVVHPGCAGMRLEQERDARGFPLGVIVPAQTTEATVGVSVSDAETVTPATVTQWRTAVAADDSVIATCVATRSVGADTTTVLWASVAAQGKPERKDTAEFLTRMARFAPVLYDSADACGMDAHPLSPDQITDWVGTGLLGDDSEAGFPPTAARIMEGPAALVADDTVTISFEITCTPDNADEDICAVVDQIGQQLSAAANGALMVRMAVWDRIAVDGNATARRVGVVSLVTDDSEASEAAARALIGQLTARQRLRVRRMWHRQAMAAGASLGAGVLGWQRLEVSA